MVTHLQCVSFHQNMLFSLCKQNQHIQMAGSLHPKNLSKNSQESTLASFSSKAKFRSSPLFPTLKSLTWLLCSSQWCFYPFSIYCWGTLCEIVFLSFLTYLRHSLVGFNKQLMDNQLGCKQKVRFTGREKGTLGGGGGKPFHQET